MSVWLAPDPQQRAADLVARLPEFAHVQGAAIAWLFSTFPLRLHGERKAAFIAVPTVQGPMRDYFEWSLEQLVSPLGFDNPLDFVVFVDAGMYESCPTDAHRERLVYHELCHVEQKVNRYGAPLFSKVDGRPLLRLRGHDTEVFDAEVARYGEAIVGLQTHVQALREGRRRARAAAEAQTPDEADRARSGRREG